MIPQAFVSFHIAEWTSSNDNVAREDETLYKGKTTVASNFTYVVGLKEFLAMSECSKKMRPASYIHRHIHTCGSYALYLLFADVGAFIGVWSGYTC
jgi:hypothetical protein